MYRKSKKKNKRMREVTKLMIRKYALKSLGYDFMAFPFSNEKQLSFHHLIIPKRLSEKRGIGDGYVMWNGAILVQDTSHNYLHIIEKYDRDMFLAITHEMIDENQKGYLDIKNLERIDDILKQFEKEYANERTRKGSYIIKEEYTKRLVKR
jgi:hypothetical protein